MELKNLLLDAQKDLADYSDDVEMGVRNERPEYHDYLESTVKAYEELTELRSQAGHSSA